MDIFPVYVDKRKDCDVYEGDGLYIERLQFAYHLR